MFFAIRAYIERPRDLGPKLHYVGKVSGGCLIPVCDSLPGATYYFATDMSLDETMQYFKGAKCVLPENVRIEVDCELDKTSFGYGYFYNDPEKLQNYGQGVRDLLKASKKPLIISIDSSEYRTARDAL